MMEEIFDSFEGEENIEDSKCSVSVIEALNSTVDECNHRISLLQSENSSLLQQLTLLEDENNEFSSKSQNLEREVVSLRETFLRCDLEKEDVIAELQQTIRICEESKNDVQKELDKIRDEKLDLHSEIERCEEKCTEYEEIIKEAMSRESKMLEQINDTQALAENEVEQNTYLSSLLSETQQSLKSKDEELKKLENKFDELKRELAEKDYELIAANHMLKVFQVSREAEKSDCCVAETDACVELKQCCECGNVSKFRTLAVQVKQNSFFDEVQNLEKETSACNDTQSFSSVNEIESDNGKECSSDLDQLSSIDIKPNDSGVCVEANKTVRKILRILVKRSVRSGSMLKNHFGIISKFVTALAAVYFVVDTSFPPFWSWEDRFRLIVDRFVVRVKSDLPQ